MDVITSQRAALKVADYARLASQSDRFAQDSGGLQKVCFGYFGEIGGLLAALKKISRDELIETDTQFAAEEIGDALWYLFAVANLSGISPGELGEACLCELRKKFNEVTKSTFGEASFRHIDAMVAAQGDSDRPSRVDLLGELAATAGVLAQDGRCQNAFGEEGALAGRLGNLLALLAMTASSFGLQLELIAGANLNKIKDRWPGDDRTYLPFFDDGTRFPPHEQFERTFTVKFEQRQGGDRPHVVQSINGVFIGDRLTDNSVEPDGYRFHDVFHLAYVAHLGWSPVIRGLLKRKRKSIHEVDENQDGARAMIIEEGIATWIFNHAKPRNFYRDVDEGKLEYGLLKQIRSMVQGYEVQACPLWQWERAVLEGFKVFRELFAAEGGLVHVDMNSHSLTFESLPAEAG